MRNLKDRRPVPGIPGPYDRRVLAHFWVAVREFNLGYHNMDICYIIRFLDYGN